MQTSQYESMMATHTNPPMAGEHQPQLSGLGAHHRALGNTRALVGGGATLLAAGLFIQEFREDADAMRYGRVLLAMLGGYALSYSMR